MKELVISPDFTMEDIEKIREYHAERERVIGKAAFRAEAAAAADFVEAQIKEIRERKTRLYAEASAFTA